MNTKHFLTATLLILGFLISSLHADAQRHRGHHRNYYQQNNRRACPPPMVYAPRPAYRHMPSPRRMIRRHVLCAPLAYFAPAPRRHYNRRWR